MGQAKPDDPAEPRDGAARGDAPPRCIFISYRREDSSGFAGRLCEDIRSWFDPADVFMDIDSIQPGTDFREVVAQTLDRVSVVLALIGPRWLGARDKNGHRRLDAPDDMVAIEIAEGLRRASRVIPLLVGGAPMPKPEELPQSIRKLADLNGFEVSDGRWRSDMERLRQVLEEILGKPGWTPITDRIANFRILEKIGEGGMGEVYLAQQQSPLQRKVALKIIKLGMDTKQVVARFDAERQALAMMNHPNVARVYDAGSTSRGRPYFVMEYVKGHPITDHCDRQRLKIRERLQLFRQACEGVQHAHQKGIIHRDIKPSNILVHVLDDVSVPKVIDFGVAKATTQPLTEKTLHTQFGQTVGTPEYMSPEQAEASPGDIDPRTDVYSLGVVLYELLTGTRPLSLEGATDAEIRRRILEEQPAKPSSLVRRGNRVPSTAAESRGMETSVLARHLRGDLDRIAAKALAKDRSQRYWSAAELAADVSRYLSHRPVVASSPSPLYRARKFLRRHRVALGTVGLALLALAFGLQAWRSSQILRDQEMDRLLQSAETAVGLGQFQLAVAQWDKISRSSPAETSARLGRARVAAIGNLSQETLGEDPESFRERVIQDLSGLERVLPGPGVHYLRSRVYENLGHEEPARRERELANAQEPSTSLDFEVLGDLHRAQGACDAAIDSYQQALRLDPHRSWSMIFQALCASRTGNSDLARTNYEVLSRLRPDHVLAHNNLGNFFLRRREYEDALASYRRAVSASEGQNPLILANYGFALLKSDDPATAERLLRDASAQYPDHSRIRSLRGDALYELDRLAEAAEQYKRSITIERKGPGPPDSKRVAIAAANLCDLFINTTERNLDEASYACKLALDADPGSSGNHYNMAGLHILSGRPDEALAFLCRAYELGDHDHSTLQRDVVFEPLRDDSRFERLIRTMRAQTQPAAGFCDDLVPGIERGRT